MIDFSQYGEQAAILSAFEGREPGRLFDIGAFNAECFSNSRALILAGWSGVLIEPSPTCMLNLLSSYGDDPRVKLIQAAVALEPGMIDLHVTDDAVSTSNEAEYEKWKNTAKFRGRMLVPALTLVDLGTRFGGPDFISIDAEGFSADLCLQMLGLGWRPHCIAVEHDGRTTELLSAATQANYVCVLTNSTNLVLVRWPGTKK